ncbi:MAG: DUF1461 domain-containing protein [Bacilli bacterium]
MKKKWHPLVYQSIIVSFNIFLMIILVWMITIFATKSLNFYMFEFIKNDTTNVTGYTIDELRLIAQQIIDYLFYRVETMQIQIGGQDVFSNQALFHMADVRTLYRGGSLIGWIVLALEIGLATILITHYQFIKNDLLKISLSTLGIIFAILVAIGLLAMLDFDQSFEMFHHIIFPDPVKFKDAFFGTQSNYSEAPGINNLMLVLILSEGLFMDVGLLIVGGTMSGLVLWIVAILGIRTADFKRKRGHQYA